MQEKQGNQMSKAGTSPNIAIMITNSSGWWHRYINSRPR